MTGFDLGESADDADPETDEQSEQAETSAEQTGQSEQASESSSSGQAVDPREEPAFPFSDDLRESWYVRGDVLDEFEDAVDFNTKRELREHGVRNETGREVQDAAIQVAANHPEEVAEIILEQRGVTND